MLKKTTIAAACILISVCSALADDPPYGGVKLLKGYRYERSATVDTINGRIYKEHGLSIEFESGISEGYAVDPRENKNYLWYREQEINGHKVFVALTRPGVNTKWKPKKSRRAGLHILMATFPGKFGPLDAANFYAEVADDTEIADALLMIFTFDPTK
ncbi:MAG: hypothetical protein JOZ96_23570 [Acidobacteria bacterium]|nr:hypothetical protein [Acidobacteriota bacterium]